MGSIILCGSLHFARKFSTPMMFLPSVLLLLHQLCGRCGNEIAVNIIASTKCCDHISSFIIDPTQRYFSR